jgi:hypothetical protein
MTLFCRSGVAREACGENIPKKFSSYFGGCLTSVESRAYSRSLAEVRLPIKRKAEVAP